MELGNGGRHTRTYVHYVVVELLGSAPSILQNPANKTPVFLRKII